MLSGVLVQTLGEVRRGNNDDTFALLETVHLDQQLVQGLLHVLLITATTFATDGIELVDENDGGLLLASSCKDFADTFGANSDKHFFKVRPAHN